jgi:hypothetical protein
MSFNVTIPLADRYAAAKAAFDAADAALKALKDEVKELGAERVTGITCDLTLSLSEQMRLDQKKVALLLTPEQIEACKSPVLVETIRIKAKGLVA